MNLHLRLFMLTRGSRLALALSILSGFFSAMFALATAGLLSRIISQVFLDRRSLAGVTGLLYAMLVVIGLRAVLAWGGEIASSSLAARVKSALRGRLLAQLRTLGPSFSRGERTGELTAVLTDGVEALDPYYAQYLPQLALGVLVPVAFLCIVLPLDPLTGIVLLLTAPLLPLFLWLTGKAAQEKTRGQWSLLGRLSAHFLDSLQGLTTLKVFGRSREQLDEIRKISERFRDTTLDVMRWGFLSALALELVASLSTAVIAVEVGLRLLYFQMNFERALFLLILAPEFYLPLRNLGLRFHAGVAGSAAAQRIFAILDAPATPASVEKTARPGSWRKPPRLDSLVWEGICFAYPGEESPALQHTHLKISAGEHIALVGYSGAGKSTFADLLLRFADPSEGRILVNEIPMDQIDPEAWRELIAWMPQKPHLFHDTIANNIRLGRPAASPAEIVAAVEAARLDEFISSLPQAYESVIGEGGARLSEGEAQRLAMARVILKDAPLLILDEPTSSLDAETEMRLDESVARFAAGRMMITIAHRLNAAFRADQIYFFQNGRIVEEGSHRELIRRGGAYASFVLTHGLSADMPTHAVRFLTDCVSANNTEMEKIISGDPPRAGPPRRVLGHLFSFLRPSLGWVAISILLGVLTVGSNVSLMGLSAYLLSSAALHPSIAELEVAIVGVRFFGIARGAFRYLERLVSHRVNMGILAEVRVWFYRALEPLAPARLMDFRAGDLLHRAVADVDTLDNFFVRIVAPPAVAAAVGFAMWFFCFGMHPKLGWVLLGFWFLLGFLLPVAAYFFSRRPGAEAVMRYSELRAKLVDGIQGLADILAFGRGRNLEAEVIRADGLFARARRQQILAIGFLSFLAAIFTHLGLLAMLFAAIPLVESGAIPGVLLAALALGTLASFEAVLPVSAAAQTLGGSLAAARRLYSIVAVSPELQDPRLPAPSPPGFALSVRNLRFSYGRGGRPALDGISFDLPEGGCLAIVGPSGAGKSTLAYLLLRFWEFAEGTIELDGRDFRELTQADVRKKFSLVSRNTYFFNNTILENLRMARPQTGWEEIIRATRDAGIHEFIAHLPDGYNTMVGEQGVRLSAGERQRLAIARALLKDAPIIVLDEPTANLDAPTEKEILQRLLARLRGRTILHITHRLVGLESFDAILVMDRGRIVERGQHAELLHWNGLYRRMADSQNRIFTEAETVSA